jgi:hypothetical protein
MRPSGPGFWKSIALAGLAVSLTVFASAAAAPRASAAVVLNEVNCEGTDWVELAESGGAAADISGWLLTDDPITDNRADHRHLFPPGTEIPAGAPLVIERGAGGFPFGISCGSDHIRLADTVPGLADETQVPELTDPAETWGRLPDGTGAFVQTASTQGEPNESSNAGPPPDPSWMFDGSAVHGIDLTLPPASIDALAGDPEEYVDGTFAMTQGAETYGPLAVGVRLKGGGSFRPLTGKAAFKIDFNHSVPGQRFHGLKKLTLNNMVQDPTGIRERLSYELFRATGVPAPRTGYANVAVNGAPYGLYLNLETIDDVFLSEEFASTNHLYEGEYGEDVHLGHVPNFEVDEGSEANRTDLLVLATAVGAASPPSFSARVAGYADLEEMTRMWAVERYVGHWDGYTGGLFAGPLHPNNYYLHSDASGVFSMLPWGADQTWDLKVPFDSGADAVLFDKCLEDPPCREMFREAMRSLLVAEANLGVGALAAQTAGAIAGSQAADPRKESTPAATATALATTLAFVSSRPGEATAWLDPPPPAGPAATPDTAITKRTRRPRLGRKVLIHFSSDVPGSRFQCRLGNRDFVPCPSPYFFTPGRAGTKRFAVRAIAPSGAYDATPAVLRFEVRRPK